MSESHNSNDIDVPAQEMNDFFFMDQDEEQEKYGATTNIPDALSGNVVKDASQNKVSSSIIFSSILKCRVLLG